jgi:hypothetical protein
VFIGPGYFLSGGTGNAGLQANPNTATIDFVLDTLSSGTQFIGLSGSFYPANGVDDITITRCFISNLLSNFNGTFSNFKLTQCYFNNINMYKPTENWQVTNNIGSNSTFSISVGTNNLVRNNTFYNCGAIDANNAYFANNLLLGNTYLNYVLNSTIKYNMSVGSLPAGNNNQSNVPQSSIIIGTGSIDGRFQLMTGSAATGAGEPVNGETPDLGAYGTAAPYRLSGIPPIPTIYALTVPASIPSNATTMTITISTRSNN